MFRCAAIFTDHMVLLRDRRVCIWGQCSDTGIVTITIGDICVQTEVSCGEWKAYLPPHHAGGPYELKVCCNGEEICFTDVMYGEVLLAAGQSNMELALADCESGQEELATAAYPDIRFYNTYKTGYIDAQVEDVIREQQWNLCKDGEYGDMSAVAYYAAKTIYQELNVPIGIIDCYQGGTSIVSWLGEDILREYSFGVRSLKAYEELVGDKTDEQYEQEVCEYWRDWHAWDDRVREYKKSHPDAQWEAIEAYAGACPWPQPAGKKSVFRPAGCYETMVKQVAPYTIAGVMYYQGETDACDSNIYYELMDRLIRDWRDLFENRELNFVITQLPMYIEKGAEDDFTWARMREQQLAVYEGVKNTELLVLGDCGEYGNIHPVDKKTPGIRLGRLLLDHMYHRIDDGGPMLPGKIYREDEKIILECKNTYGNILIENETPDRHWVAFEVAGIDGEYRECEFYAEGDRIILYGEGVGNAVTVRYAWFNYGKLRIFNAAHTPLAPFGARNVC